MKRDLTALAEKEHDVLVIGGGIYGACVAWEAARRGLSVALVEKADFGAATSANSLKIIHGGFRYLQHGDLKRIRVSSGERTRLMALAPHLVHPLPVVLPAYGHGLRGREAFALALLANELLTYDRNRFSEPEKRIPRGQLLSPQDCLDILPGVLRENLTGGALFYDAQVYNPERLVLAFLRSAVQHGASVTNYVRATALLQKDDRVIGAVIQDRLDGSRYDKQFPIRAKIVVNTAGPWVEGLLEDLRGRRPQPARFAKAFNIVTRPIFADHAVGLPGRVQSQNGNKDGKRFFFFAPWRDYSLIGTDYIPYDGTPDDFQIHAWEVQEFLSAVNQTYSGANLRQEDVKAVLGGLVPIHDTPTKDSEVQLVKQDHINDHRRDGISGLISVVGSKYTTARAVAERVAERLLAKLGRNGYPDKWLYTHLYGGDIDGFSGFLRTACQQETRVLETGSLRRLVYNYGSAYPNVLRYLSNQEPADDWSVLQAETRHAIYEEMAQTLADVIFRRTEIGTAGYPGDKAIWTCADVMWREMDWDSAKLKSEIAAVHELFVERHALAPHHTITPSTGPTNGQINNRFNGQLSKRRNGHPMAATPL